MHSRFAGGSALSQAPLPAVSAPSPLAIRNDLDVPVMVVEAEGDVIGSNLGVRQPDTSKFREWEIAGTSHADSYILSVGPADVGDGNGAAAMFAFMRSPQSVGCTSPVNAGSHHWVLDTAFHDLDAWVRNGVAPPTGTRLQVVSTSPRVLARDAEGNALGGVRTPQVDARFATLTGINSGSGFCTLFGSTTPLTTAQLSALYPTHADFVAKWTTALSSAVAQGFILPADEASSWPRRRVRPFRTSRRGVTRSVACGCMALPDDAAAVVARLHLSPHPEGGYFRVRTAARSRPRLPLGRDHGHWRRRSCSCCPRACVRRASSARRGVVVVARRRPMALDIGTATHVVGPDLDESHELQCLVPAGTWQSATPATDRWSLVACVVAPGFDFADFEMRG